MLALLAGCMSKTVRFAENSPYSPVFRHAGWAAFVYPDDLGAQKTTFGVPGFIVSQRYKVFWGGAITTQAQARFQRCFEEGAVLMSETEAAEIERLIAAARADGESPGSDSKAWAIAVGRAWESASPDLAESAPDAAARAKRPPAVIVRLKEPTIEFASQKPIVRFNAVATEPITTRILLDADYRAQGETILATQSQAFTSKRIQETIVNTVNGALIQLAAELEAEMAD